MQYYPSQFPRYISFLPCHGPETERPEPPPQKKINQHRYLHSLNKFQLTYYVTEQREGRTREIPELEEDGYNHWNASVPFSLVNCCSGYATCTMSDLDILYAGEGKWTLLLLGESPSKLQEKLPLLFFIHNFWQRADGVIFANGHWYDYRNDQWGAMCIPQENICFATY
ncbi:MAG: hypothetical protein M0T74_15775 [Desulfitobacterium hafniense]|nr:hypothetical protein [Desulfitobacterium hafniense]